MGVNRGGGAQILRGDIISNVPHDFGVVWIFIEMMTFFHMSFFFFLGCLHRGWWCTRIPPTPPSPLPVVWIGLMPMLHARVYQESRGQGNFLYGAIKKCRMFCLHKIKHLPKIMIVYNNTIIKFSWEYFIIWSFLETKIFSNCVYFAWAQGRNVYSLWPSKHA